MIKPVSYLQIDQKWKAVDYSAKGEKTDIGESGCGPSCMAMVIATLKDSLITPVDTCAWALKNGYKAPKQGTYYSYFVPQGKEYGIEVKRLNYNNLYGHPNYITHDVALDEIKKGNWIIACMGKGLWTSSGHYVLWYGMSGNDVLINDPNSTKPNKLRADYDLFKSQVKYYFVVEVNVSPSDSLKKEWTAAKAQGITDGTFPAKYITREQVATMIYRSLKSKKMAKVSEAWAWAKAEGITDGSNPKNNCTREQAITMLYRALTGKSMAAISEAWAWARSESITDGSNPKKNCTREQLAAFIIRKNQ